MDVELVRIPRRKEALNLLTGLFHKSVFFLGKGLSKSEFAGIFKNLGIVFNGRHGPVYWSFDILNNFSPHLNDLTVTLQNKNKQYFRLNNGEDIKIQNIFGKPYVFLYDGEHTCSLS